MRLSESQSDAFRATIHKVAYYKDLCYYLPDLQKHLMPEQPSQQGDIPVFGNSDQPPEQKVLSSLVVSVLIGSGSSDSTIEALAPDMKSRLSVLLVAHLQNTRVGSPRENRNWQARAHILGALDQNAYSRLQETVISHLRETLVVLARSWPDASSIDDYRERLAELHQLLLLQRDRRAIEMCSTAMGAVEDGIRRVQSDNVASYARDSIALSEKHEAAARGTSFPILRDAVRALSNLQSLPLTEQDGYYLYRHSEANGGTSAWRIELHHNTPLCSVRSVDNGNVLLTLEIRELLEALENNQLPNLIRQAQQNYQKEHALENVKALVSFDLPREEPVAHLRLFPRPYDELVSRGLHTSCLLSLALQHRYPNLRANPIIFADNPKQALLERIRTLHDNGRGTRHFLIDIVSHGERDSLSFPERFTAQDVLEIVRTFPDCHFTFNTVACFGGGLFEGLQKALREDPAVRNRVTVFLQTRGNTPNPATNARNANLQFPAMSDHYLHFIEALYDPGHATYGAAFRHADLAVKRYWPADAEALIHGIHVGRLLPSRPDSPPSAAAG